MAEEFDNLDTSEISKKLFAEISWEELVRTGKVLDGKDVRFYILSNAIYLN
jgi:hypothetical protein